MMTRQHLAYLALAGLVVLAGCGSEAVSLGGVEVPIFSALGETATQLEAVAEATILASGLELDAEAERQLSDLVARAELAVALNPDRRAEATANLANLLAAVVGTAVAEGDSVVTPATLETALSVCPIWPFC